MDGKQTGLSVALMQIEIFVIVTSNRFFFNSHPEIFFKVSKKLVSMAWTKVNDRHWFP